MLITNKNQNNLSMELNLKEEIKKVLNEKKIEGLHVSEITDRIIASNNNLFTASELPEKEQLIKKINGILHSDVNKKSGNEFSKVKNHKTNKFKKGYYKIKAIRLENQIPAPTPPDKTMIVTKPNPIIQNPEPGTLFTGKAGECAVMSELLFRGYNANLMMVDDGVDIVASKNNLYYFIQVKTTVLNEKSRIYTHIKKDRFDAFLNSQIRYIIVARCKISGIETNLYFIFNNQNIDEFIFDKVVNLNESTISIKIRIDQNNGNKPFLYHDNKEKDITFFMNNFNI